MFPSPCPTEAPRPGDDTNSIISLVHAVLFFCRRKKFMLHSGTGEHFYKTYICVGFFLDDRRGRKGVAVPERRLPLRKIILFPERRFPVREDIFDVSITRFDEEKCITAAMKTKKYCSVDCSSQCNGKQLTALLWQK